MMYLSHFFVIVGVLLFLFALYCSTREWKWVGKSDNVKDAVYFNCVLAKWNWNKQPWTLRLHKFVQPDDFKCYHTHPAHAWRFILWGGYVEEILTYEHLEDAQRNGGWISGHFVPTPHARLYEVLHWQYWKPMRWGYVPPELCHRVTRLLNKRVSYSLWIHGPKVASIELHGMGWPPDVIEKTSKQRLRGSASRRIGTEDIPTW